MIEVKNLTKKYGSFTAVENISFTIEKGHIYGLLGPNGAGKSTTMNIITGCLAATEGTVTVNGHDIYEEAKAAKKNIGYLPEIPPLYNDMTPYEYLKFVGKAKGLSKAELPLAVETVMEKTGVTDVADRLIKNLSKGYKQRVGIAQALLGNPEIIILDEPTVGLDPTQLVEIRSLIRALKEDHAVILSSHIMGEITAVCDYLIMIAGGKIVKMGTLEEIENAGGNTVTIESRGTKELLEPAINAIADVKYTRFTETGTTLKAVIEVKKGVDIREELFNIYASLGAPILSISTSSTDLEDLFIKLSEEARPAAERTSSKGKGVKPIYTPSPLGKAYLDGEDKKTAAAEENTEAEEEYRPLFGDETEKSENDEGGEN